MPTSTIRCFHACSLFFNARTSINTSSYSSSCKSKPRDALDSSPPSSQNGAAALDSPPIITTATATATATKRPLISTSKKRKRKRFSFVASQECQFHRAKNPLRRLQVSAHLCSSSSLYKPDHQHVSWSQKRQPATNNFFMAMLSRNISLISRPRMALF